MPPDTLSATRQATTVVANFLSAIGGGDADTAARYLDPGVRMLFPGGKVYSSLGALADASSSRYRHVDKHEMEYEPRVQDDGDVVVFVTGSLFGENSFGVRFDHVRFVDRFVVRDGLIVDQRVWNDLAETGVLRAETSTDLDPAWRPGPAAAPSAAKVRRTGHLRWSGDLRDGSGRLDLAGGAARDLAVSLQTRKQANGSTATSPEELLAAAHAACFGMALRGALDRLADRPAEAGRALEVDGVCTLRIDDQGWRIESVDLTVRADDADPQVLAEAIAQAEKGCAVSKALAGNVAVTVTVAAPPAS